MIKENKKEEVLEVEVEEVKEEPKVEEKTEAKEEPAQAEQNKEGEVPSTSPAFYKEMSELLKMNQAQQAELTKLIKSQTEQIKQQREQLEFLKNSIPSIEYDKTAHIEGRFDFNHISRDLINDKTKTEKDNTFQDFQLLKSIFR